MIKGCQKKIIIIKDTGNKYFEEAHFIVKNECLGSEINEYNIIKDATAIVNDYKSSIKLKRTKRNIFKHLLYFILGVLFGSGLCIGLYFMFI